MPITEQQLISGGSNPVDYSTPFRPQTPTVGQAASNEISYYLGGYAERARQIATYGTKIEDGYDFTKHIPKGKESYATAFARTVNPQHAADVSKFIDERKQLRQDQSDTPIGTALIGSLANPVNYLAIPIGISSTAARATFTTIATRGAIATGASELALNVGIQMTDPVQSMAETFMNTATAAAFGGVGAGLFSVPTIRRANALEKVRTQSNAVFSAAQSMDTMGGVTIGSIDRFQPRKNRPLGDSDTVDQELAQVNARLSDLDRELATIPDDSGMRRIVEDDIEALKLERSSLADEVFYRKVEDAGVSLDDLYRPSKGADNVFINFVTNPLRRTLTDNYGSANNELKRLFVTLAADAGTQLNLHEMGIAAPLSVHQLATTDIGKFGATYDSMIKLWAEDTNAPEPSPTSLLNNSDVNLTSVARNVQGNRGGIVDWFTEVNQRRIAGGEMTSAQSKAAKMIDDYFASWEARLIETGQIRTRETLARKIDDVKLELDLLQSRVSDAPQVRQSDDLIENFDDAPSLSDDIASLQRELAELEFEFENPVSTDRAEPFFPRYWNQAVVKKNREELKSIISNWFVQQPYIIRYNEATFKYERINLSSDADQISARADEAIESILGNKLDETPVFTGKGRPSPLMSRQLDIPNSLVLKFIEQNPINVMAAYTARTSSSYHFAKQFGGSRDKVVKDMNKKMVMAKVSRDKRAKTIRDFNHLYDRVVGRVIQEPDAWNQKAAAVLRDVTSFTYLGGAGIAAIGDFGRIVMEHESQNIVRTAQAFFDPVLRKASVYETRVAGGAMDMLLGSAHLRMMDDQNYNVLSNGVMDRARNVFHTINLLGPTTTLGKQFSGALAGHYLIELSQKVARGEASEFEVTYLARHGIDADVAKLISESPYQVDTRTGLILPNTSEWVGNYKVPTVDNDRVRIVEVNEDGSSVGKMNDNGEYVSAYYRPNEGGDGGTIYFDREHIEGEKFQQKAWTKPRMEGVKPLPEDAFKTAREWANFVMLHEIMHTRFSAEDLGFVKRQSGEIVINNAPSGMSRQEIINNLESGVDNPDLVFHVTNQPQSIINDGFVGGGTVRGKAILDSGYGDYVTVFDIRDIVEKIKSNQEILDEFQITEDQVDQFLAQKMYGESALLSKYSAGGVDSKYFNLLGGQKPVAVIHISELPQFRSRRFEGDRASELGDEMGLATAEDAMMQDYRSGVLNKDSYDDYNAPQSYWGLSWDELSKELDKSIELENTFADIGKNYNPFEERVSRPSTVVDKASYENKINQLAMAEHKKSQQVAQDTVDRLRAAINTSINNTVMMATAADKPIIMDGVLYVKASFGARLGLSPDPRNPAYSRIENAFLALPLQFYSYSFANVNKTVGLMMQNGVRSRHMGVAAMMGLGYMVTAIRTPDTVWQNMSIQDKVARSFDMGGIAALYSDLFYTTLQTSLAVGGPNITGGVIQPRFPQKPNMVDAVTNITGASSSWVADMGVSASLFASGEYGEGASKFVKNLPFSNLWFLRGEVNEFSRYLRGQ